MISANVKQWIEIAGGVALIASVGLVVIEIRQNTDAVSAQAVSDLNHQANESNLAIASNPELAELFVRLEADPGSVSATDRLRGEYFARGFFNRVYTAYTFHQRGIFSEADYEGWLRTTCSVLKREGPARIWADNPPFEDRSSRVMSIRIASGHRTEMVPLGSTLKCNTVQIALKS